MKLAVLISGEGTNLQAIIDSISNGALDASIAIVISNQSTANGLARAKKAAIPTEVIRHRKGQTKAQHDQILIQAIKPHAPDLIVLAGYLRILSSLFVRQYAGKIINIHPSLLPAYKGLNTHQRVLDAKERYHGASVHYVTEALDEGELILQSRIKVSLNDNVRSLAQRIHHEEHLIYPRAIAWLASKDG